MPPVGEALAAAGGLLLLALICLGHRLLYRYRIGRRSLVVTWAGIPVRRIRISDIESIGKRRRGRAENWSNTWRTRHRILVIRKRSGWFRELLVTPAYRYEFRHSLHKAMERIQRVSPPAGPGRADPPGPARSSARRRTQGRCPPAARGQDG